MCNCTYMLTHTSSQTASCTPTEHACTHVHMHTQPHARRLLSGLVLGCWVLPSCLSSTWLHFLEITPGLGWHKQTSRIHQLSLSAPSLGMPSLCLTASSPGTPRCLLSDCGGRGPFASGPRNAEVTDSPSSLLGLPRREAACPWGAPSCCTPVITDSKARAAAGRHRPRCLH